MKPSIGQPIDVHGIPCRIIRIHPLGTIDVKAIDSERYWRITGLRIA